MAGTFNVILHPVSTKDVYVTGDMISGVIEFQTHRSVDVKEIYVKLTGVSRTTFNEKVRKTSEEGEQDSRRKRHSRHSTEITYHNETHEFLNIQEKVFPNGQLSHSTTHTFMANTYHSFEFQVQIPRNCQGEFNNEPLPPSFTTKETLDTDTVAQISYKFEAKLVTSGFFSWNKTFEMPIEFSPSYYEDLTYYNTNLRDGQGSAPVKHIYSHKVQKYLDSHEKGVIASPIESGHKYTSFFWGLFNENYKWENYNKLVKDVPLEVTVLTSNVYAPGHTFGLFQLEIFSPVQSLVPYYILNNGNSSELGKFAITRTKCTLYGETRIRIQNVNRRITQRMDLCDLKFNDYYVDIAAFDEIDTGHMQVFDLLHRLDLSIPSKVVPGFSCCDGQIRRSYKLMVELSIQGDRTEKKFFFKKDIRIVDLGYWDSETASPPWEMHGSIGARRHDSRSNEKHWISDSVDYLDNIGRGHRSPARISREGSRKERRHSRRISKEYDCKDNESLSKKGTNCRKCDTKQRKSCENCCHRCDYCGNHCEH